MKDLEKNKQVKKQKIQDAFIYSFIDLLFFFPACLIVPGLFSATRGRREVKKRHQSMQIAHRDKFPFTDLSLLMGIREKGFNWLAANMSAERTHALSRGCRAEERDYSESKGDADWSSVRMTKGVCRPRTCACHLYQKKEENPTFSPSRRCLPFQRHVVERADLWCSAESKKSISPSAVWLIISLVYNGAYANPTTCPHTRHMQMGASGVFIRQILETERKSGVESSLCRNSHGGDSAQLV